MAHRGWHIVAEAGGVTVSRAVPVCRNVAARTRRPAACAGLRPFRVAHPVRQDVSCMLPRRRGFVPAVRAVVQAACLAEPAVVRAVVRAIVRAAGRVAAAPDRARHMAVLAEVPGDPVQRGPRVTRAASEAWMERGVR